MRINTLRGQVGLLSCWLVALLASSSQAAQPNGVRGYAAPGASNPIIPGYFADPSIVQHDGRYFLYATIDPWGGDTLGCWESGDLKNWTYRVLNWPTKKDCTSPTSSGAKVWAPSVIRGSDGRFHMYVSVGSEVWVGVADQPLGPWKNALEDNRPLVPRNFRPGFHMIDAEAFIDTDGKAYLYWGSGLNWVNGRCWVAQLSDDMKSFASEVKDVTPANFFEGPIMLKRGGKYYLMYSNGNTTKDTYQVHYAVGDNPFGPFTEGKNSPILKTDKALDVVSPGHHTLLEKDGRTFIVYHRAAIPQTKDTNRQICVEPLTFAADGSIETVTPTHDGARSLQQLTGATTRSTTGNSSGSATRSAAGATSRPAASASSAAGADFGAERLADRNFATLWRPGAASADGAAWAQLDLASVREISKVVVLPEFATRTYRFSVQISEDGSAWKTIADASEKGISGSPLTFAASARARYVRVAFPPGTEPQAAGIWELEVE